MTRWKDPQARAEAEDAERNDTREKLEAEAWEVRRENNELCLAVIADCKRRNAGLQAKVDELAAERDELTSRYGKLLVCLENDYGMKASWDGLRKVWTTEVAEPVHGSAADWKAQARHWQRVADRRVKRVQKLKRELRTANRPHPYLGKDGKEIAVGHDIHGEDGVKWRVTGIRWGSRHPVQAVGENGLRRDLKACWCDHERPDTLNRILIEFGNRWEADEKYEGEYPSLVEEYVARIEGLGGKA